MQSIQSRLVAGIASLGALLAFVPSAFAASPDVFFSVTALPSSVSWSRTTPVEQQTYSALQVVIRNDSINTINDVRFQVCARVTDDTTSAPPTLKECAARRIEPGEMLASYAQAIGANCTSVAAGTAVSCNLGQLRGRGGITSFVVLFKAPTSGPSIRYDAVAVYGEGQNDSTGASHVDTTPPIKNVVTLGPPLGTEVKSYLPIGGGTLFTGSDGVPKGLLGGNDRYTTIVSVPRAARVEVVEEDSQAGCSPDFLVCATSTATIPGNFAFLTIVLRRHPDTLRPGAKISNAVLQYQPGEMVGDTFMPSGDPVDIPPCEADGAIPAVPVLQTRCLLKRTEYPKRYPLNPALQGVWEFVIKAAENGRTYF